jgi:myosin-7
LHQPNFYRSSKGVAQTFVIATIRGEEFTFQSPNSEDIRDLVMYFLEGLKKRSRYVIALQDYKPPIGSGGDTGTMSSTSSTSTTFLSFAKGDLIELEDDSTGETAMNTGWCVGRSATTKERGDFPAEAVYILPCLSRPPPEILALFTGDGTAGNIHSSKHLTWPEGFFYSTILARVFV